MCKFCVLRAVLKSMILKKKNLKKHDSEEKIFLKSMILKKKFFKKHDFEEKINFKKHDFEKYLHTKNHVLIHFTP